MELNRPTVFDIAFHFCASRITGATIPGSRLSNILENMFRGRALTALSRSYLQTQNLTELLQLATGQITYEAFIAALDPVLVTSEQAAKIEHQAKEAERLVQEADWRVEVQRKAEAAEATRIARAVRKNEQVEQHSRERDADEKARIDREAEWEVLCSRNREAVESNFKARRNKPDYIAPTPYDIARHYRVNHLRSAVTSPLSNILNAIYQGRPLAAAYLNYLKIKGLARLYALAIGEATYESYISGLEADEVARRNANAARLNQAEAQRLRDEAAEVARIARETDPTNILLRKYGILSLDELLMPRMIDVLQKIDCGNRLADDDVVWLNTEVQQHFTAELRRAYHLREADFCGNEYRRTQDPWDAINASAHYRKCDHPRSALELLAGIPASQLRDPRIHSALCTTHGGVMRDLGRSNEALQLGKQGHALQPRNFRPCTLLGAVCMELGKFGEGHDWYAKAEQRGASKQGIDAEVRRIFLRLDKTKREAMKVSLLAKDSKRYRWVSDKKS
ncbi:hypothetical protein [Pseudomonas putida]|uniref:hypothetical protein n=1 Tax=Pseudomonas putida TaxID=303 RepID=UPI0005BAE8A4|nr:hypothetical protein [Pseudomonas putida]